MEFKLRTAIYSVVSVIALTAITASCYWGGLDGLLENYPDIDYFELLLGQIANTLIVLSLTSVLSDNFGQVYWVEIKETKLITPFWSCFIGITAYLLSGLVFAFFSYSLQFQVGIIVSYALSTILLMLLTYKMISLYFGKEEMKKRLFVEYKQLLLLKNTPYVSDYLRRLEGYLQEVEQKEFSGKKKYIKNIKKEMAGIRKKLSAENEKLVDEAHNQHLDKFERCLERVREIDLKIEEYTNNAIDNNETEVVRENIELLVECENYDTFFNLIEEIFDWDEKYACKTLKEISKKNMAWIIRDRISFFKQYALHKLITQSGKLDAIHNLLLIYDVSNLGMEQLLPKIKPVKERSMEICRRMTLLEKEVAAAEDMFLCMKQQKTERKELQAEEENLCKELISVLDGASAKELRSFYLPIRETCMAYEEGRYEIVNKYVKVILLNFQEDVQVIKAASGIAEMAGNAKFAFSYVTDEELILIGQLIEKDKINRMIPESDKMALLRMERVVIDNDTGSNLSEEGLEIYRSTMDF